MSGNRQEKRQSITPFHLILLVIFLAVFSSFSLILLLINKKFLIDEKSVDLLDMYIRASFVLIGSTLSGIVAFFIFYLQEKSKEREKKENEEKHYENIRDEFEDNRAVLKKVIKIMGEGSLSDLATEIAEEKEVKEIFLAVYTQLNFTFYLDFLKELKNKEYSDHIKAFKKSYQIYKYLDLIINKLENKENIEQILKLIKDDIVEMNELYLGTIFKDKDE